MISILNILIAEDNSDEVLLLRQAFKRAGTPHRLQVVSDGLDALAYLKGEAAYAQRTAYPLPDVLLLDLRMPRMNGFEVLVWLRQDARYRRLMVHVLSASSRDADIQRAYDLHANSYVVKPSRMDELVALVTALHQWHQFVCLAPPAGSAKLGDQTS